MQNHAQMKELKYAKDILNCANEKRRKLFNFCRHTAGIEFSFFLKSSGFLESFSF